MKDTFFSLPRFMNLCRKEMVESWRQNVLRMVLMYGVMAVVMVWNGYFQYNYVYDHTEDPAWIFLLVAFAWALCVFGCLSASFTMEKMKTKTSRIAVLMTPATPFEKFFSRWLIFTVVFLVVFLLTYKLADYTRVLIYSLAHPEKDCIAPVDLSHIVGNADYYSLCRTNLMFGVCIAIYFFIQSLFVLGSSVWPKNSFLKTFTAVIIIGIVYVSTAAFLSRMLFVNDRFYPPFGGEMSEKLFFSLLIGAFAFFALLNWTLAYFRFKESEIINRM